jgi:hypothetical protein
MNTVLSIIKKNLHDRSSRFVFPSEAASSLWAQKICSFMGIRSIALNRFLAWDRFKEGMIRSEVQDKEPVNAVLRRLFAEDLIRRNAEAVRRGDGSAVFSALVPPGFAEDGAVFAPRMAGMLPSLKLFGAGLEAAGAAYQADDEDQDLAVLEREYAAFLEKRGLFEPSWERPPLRDREHHYYIFFPEAIEDFAEYEGILKDEPSVCLVRMEKSDPPPLTSFNSSRVEIRSVVLEIRRLYEEEGIPYEDIAVSAPDLDSMETYLFREMSLFNIPIRRRSGKALADYGTGKLFALINSCVSGSFSFSALKSLLLNEKLPWSQIALNKALINFGIENNCVSTYSDKGKQVDIWIEAFKTSPREERLRRYYLELKNSLTAMVSAHSFGDIRKHYFAFRGKWEQDAKATGFLSRGACTLEGDAVLARCIEELSSLIQIEEKYPDLAPPSPFQFFLGVLREKQYVPVQENAGVNVFPYRVAAAAPFTCHFVLNASQDAASVIYQPLRFLRQDKRKRLGFAAGDTDVSGNFFRLYRLEPWENFTPRLYISASARTFSGWAIPHSVFADLCSNEGHLSPSPGGDYFTGEQNWWADQGAADAAFPPRLFSVQKTGYENWRTVLRLKGQESYAFLADPFPPHTEAARILKERIAGKQRRTNNGETEKLPRVSATTDLNVFFRCPVLWLYRKIIEIEGLSLEAKLLDDASLGLLYHVILRDLFTRIRDEDKTFRKEHLDCYYRWAEEITGAAARNHPAFQGPLAVPLVVSQSRVLTQKIKALLGAESKYFDGYAVGELETPLDLVKDGVRLYGILDRVSISPDGAPLIVDYKTGKTPTRAESTGAADTAPPDFQMPVYVKLYEAKTGVPVDTACFFSINGHDISAVIGSPGKKRGHSREDYQETLDAVDACAGQFAGNTASLNFVPRETDPETCASCEYRCICRTVYNLNSTGRTKTAAAGTREKGDGHVD